MCIMILCVCGSVDLRVKEKECIEPEILKTLEHFLTVVYPTSWVSGHCF